MSRHDDGYKLGIVSADWVDIGDSVARGCVKDQKCSWWMRLEAYAREVILSVFRCDTRYISDPDASIWC